MTEPSATLPGRDTQLEMYRRMVRIRQFELAATDIFKRGQLKGTVHTYIGMEASGVGVCMALRDDDLIAGTHRSHGHNIAKGASLRLMMAELLGKETGYCRGRGGSMHIAAFETGSLGALAVVASGIPLAVGAGLGLQAAGRGPRRGALHRRRRRQHGQLARVAEHGRGLGAARHLRPGEQPLGRLHAHRGHGQGAGLLQAGGRLRHPRCSGGRLRRPGRLRRGYRGRGAGAGRRWPHAPRHGDVPHGRSLRRRAGGLPGQGGGRRVARQGAHRALPARPARERDRRRRRTWMASTPRSRPTSRRASPSPGPARSQTRRPPSTTSTPEAGDDDDHRGSRFRLADRQRPGHVPRHHPPGPRRRARQAPELPGGHPRSPARGDAPRPGGLPAWARTSPSTAGPSA